MSAAGDSKKTKELDARRRAALDRESTHIRLGDWSGRGDSRVSFIGMASDMHGTVCTCCPRPGGDAA